MDIHGYPWTSMDMDIHGYPWISMDIHGYTIIATEVGFVCKGVLALA
jgi:hypothetical protein